MEEERTKTDITTITADAEPPGKKTSEEGSEKVDGDFSVFWDADKIPVDNGISLADGIRFIRDFLNHHLGRKGSITIRAYTTSDSLDLPPEFEHVDPEGEKEAIEKKILCDLSILLLRQKLSKQVLLITCREMMLYFAYALTMTEGYRFLWAYPGGIYSLDRFVFYGYVDPVQLLSGKKACVAYHPPFLRRYQVDDFSFDDEENA